MTLSRLVLLGWLVWVGDIVYWGWLLGSDEPGPHGWRAYFNVVTFLGGWVILAALLVATPLLVLRWLARDRSRAAAK